MVGVEFEPLFFFCRSNSCLFLPLVLKIGGACWICCRNSELKQDGCRGQSHPEKCPLFPCFSQDQSEGHCHPKTRTIKAVQQAAEKSGACPPPHTNHPIEWSILGDEQMCDAPDRQCSQNEPVPPHLYGSMPKKYWLGPKRYSPGCVPSVTRFVPARFRTKVAKFWPASSQLV